MHEISLQKCNYENYDGKEKNEKKTPIKKVLSAFFSPYSPELKYQECRGSTHLSESEQQIAMVGSRNFRDLRPSSLTSAPAAWYPLVLVSLPSYLSTISLACLRDRGRSVCLAHISFCTNSICQRAPMLWNTAPPWWGLSHHQPLTQAMLFVSDYWAFYWCCKTTQTFVWENLAFKRVFCRESFLFI